MPASLFFRFSAAIALVICCSSLASCQTSPEDLMSVKADDGTKTLSAEQKLTEVAESSGFRDPHVKAVNGNTDQSGEQIALREADSTGGVTPSRTPALASAYSDIAEPPPEVLAIQAQKNAPVQTADAASLGDITMTPTNVRSGKNSIFSASGNGMGDAGQLPAASTLGGSLVPSEMPVLGVNAVRKSLFSPSPDQQPIVQQDMANDALPVRESVVPPGIDDEPPVLRKLSDPRPKRKIMALREPDATLPQPVELTAEQLLAMGATEQALPLTEAETAQGTQPQSPVTEPRKKSLLSSLSDLLSPGKKIK